jgi:hypothetical protein
MKFVTSGNRGFAAGSITEGKQFSVSGSKTNEGSQAALVSIRLLLG